MGMPLDVTREQLHADLREYARLAEVGYDPAVVNAVLDALGDEFWPQSWLAVRTTTHAVDERELSIRFVNLPAAANAPDRLRAEGLLEFTGHPMEKVLAAISATEPVQWGVDVGVTSGVQKIWASFPELIPVDRLLAVDGVPESARAHTGHLKRWGGDQLALIAMDFASRTMNLYASIQAPGQITPENIVAILAELGFVPPSEEELTVLASPFTIYRTFSWTSPNILRICFPARYFRDQFPDLDPTLSRFATGPVAGPGPHAAAFYAAYGPSGKYYKIQADYTSPMRFVLPGGAEVPQQR
ncbi:hypothetical protein BJY24_006584 [Nocardia transvalensis]|uniref:Uncharacterized protein n=1 Tax=Nocardia transvalensis TaxID=37333 RepID=A0A7W9ULS9_9NOCA|nr:aromatic prenyltransferase [Nocardia transvalensis]MBB5917672.1 hypothetical protein [Nocardia transvalensis]